jgi:cation diffusion facilitator CzcD-associated flavoprotein CzcO
MQQEEAEIVVAALRERRVFAHVYRGGVARHGVRVVLSDGREALWDVDGAAGLEAQVMANGMLVGFVPKIPGSEEFTLEQTIDAIASATYD